MTLWQPLNNCSRTSRYSFCESFGAYAWACHPEHVPTNKLQPTLAVNSKAFAQYRTGTTATAAIQSEPRNAHINRNACVPSSTCDTPDISSRAHPEGGPCNEYAIITCTLVLETSIKSYFHLGCPRNKRKRGLLISRPPPNFLPK